VLEFRILGPLEVWHDGRALDLGGPRGRALLAALLVRAGEPVSADVLMHDLWGEESGKRLQVTVSRLRQALGPAAARLETVAGGYRLAVEPGELDADRFEQACARGAELPPREAAAVLREALALVRGPVLADHRYEPWAQAEIRRLEEMEALAVEKRVQADLALGEHAGLVGELEALVAEHPLRERLRAQQMLALYRSGRHADALAAYREARAALDTEGLEPGPELRALEQAILTHDPSLAAPAIEAPGIPAAPPTTTIGRDDDVRDVLAALAGTRLLTLTGPGGIGKTRLATEVARAAGGRFVSLAATADADRIPALICDALLVARIPGESDTEALGRALDGGPLLLVLDNLEHLPDAGPLLADLLERHAALQLLGTSRQPLAIRAEWLFPVSPLVPGADMALFADRARARDPAFALTDDNASAVTTICERLAGMPLAIELAAARLGVLSPGELADRLSQALAVLDRGPQDAPPRQRTMRATLDWSYDLLDDEERDAFTALAVFAGGCDREAAEAITGAPLAVLESLVAKSLVTMSAGRLTLLEPVRQYAAERLAGRADAAAVHARHLVYFHDLVRRSEAPILRQTRNAAEYARLRAEHENLRVALAWALEDTPLEALALIGDLAAFCWASDAPYLFQEAAEHALAAAGDTAPPRLRARALFTLAQNAGHTRGRLEHSIEAADLFRALGDSIWLARALIAASGTSSHRGDFATGRALAGEALEHAQASGDEQVIGGALAQMAVGTPVIAEAAPIAREAASRLRSARASQLAGEVLSSTAFAALLEDSYDVALELGHEALDDARANDDPFLLGLVKGNLALAHLLGGDQQAAQEAFTDQLVALRAGGFTRFYFEPLLGLAALAAAAGDDVRAGVLDAAAWARVQLPLDEAERPVYERVTERFIAPARERLGDGWESAAAAGRAMTAEDAVAFALDEPALLPH
jgi:predicted ATPase/DNA-binding SARP family transcriptional activator